MNEQYQSSIYPDKTNPAYPVQKDHTYMPSAIVMVILVIGLVLVIGSIKYAGRNDEKI